MNDFYVGGKEHLYCYHFRMNDDQNRIAAIEPYVRVNFGGTVFTKEPIDLGEDGCLKLTEETEPDFLGRVVSVGAFIDGDMEQDETQNIAKRRNDYSVYEDEIIGT